MSKLALYENRKLVLKKLLVAELRGIEFEQLDTEIQKFMNQIKILNVKVFGPLVTYNRGLHIQEDGKATVDYDLLVQAEDYLQYRSHFKTFPKITCEHCVLLKFDDHPNYLNLAYSKLDLYFYENGLTSDGTVYNVITYESQDRVSMDIFRPVRGL